MDALEVDAVLLRPVADGGRPRDDAGLDEGCGGGFKLLTLHKGKCEFGGPLAKLLRALVD
jgi:hypothetical protein